MIEFDGPPCRFGSPGAMRRELTALVVAGTKVATAGLLDEFAVPPVEPLPTVGMVSAVIDDDEQVVGAMRTTRVATYRYVDVPWQFALDEGEGFRDIEDWREQHRAYFERWSVPKLTAYYGREWSLADDTLVHCEWFTFEAVEPFPATDLATTPAAPAAEGGSAS